MLDTNTYFNGNVVSIAYDSQTLAATVGVMKQGDYEFGTSQREYMTVVDGSLTVKLPGSESWVTFGNGETFIVEANQKFGVKVDVDTAYLCKYEDAE